MRQKTSWQSVHSWYNKHQKSEGGYYHREVILPKLLKVLDLKPGDKLLDLGCGEGILERKLPQGVTYVGVDASKGLLKMAKQKSTSSLSTFVFGDMTKPLNLDSDFSHMTLVLSLQNVSNPKAVFEQSKNYLTHGGSLTLVLNHPCFRIPKHSSWDFDNHHKVQYRRLDRYMSPFRVSIQAHPSKGEHSPSTVSFHRPLSFYFNLLKENGFYVEDFLEVTSNKKSYGKNASRENYARDEFPLFSILHCKLKDADRG